MKFKKLYITGFGALQNLELPEIGPGLNIIEGANEAGKTTLLEFIRALFFGFAQRDKSTDDAQRYLPKNGGPHGGWAIAHNSHGEQLRIERIGDKTSAGQEKVQILNSQRETSLEALLGGADRMLYEQIFAFSLDELNSLSISAEQMEKRVYAASSGNMELLSALEKTRKAADDVYTKRSRSLPLNVALADFRKLQSQIKELSDQIESYNADRAQLQTYQIEAAQLREDMKIAERNAIEAKLQHAVWPTWIKLTKRRNDLAALPPLPSITPEQIHSMEEWRVQRQQCQDKIAELRLQLERIVESIEKCIVDKALLENAAAINFLKDNLAVYEATIRELPSAQQKLSHSNQHIHAQLEQLGPHWNEAHLKAIDISREPRIAIQQFEKVLEESRRHWDNAVHAVDAITRQIAEHQKSIQRLREEMQREFAQEPPKIETIEHHTRVLQDATELFRAKEDATLRGNQLKETLQSRQKYFSQAQDNVYTPKVLLPLWSGVIPLIIGIGALALLRNELGISLLVAALIIAVAISWMAFSQLKNVQQFEIDQQRQQSLQNAELAQIQQQIDSCDAQASGAREQLENLQAQLKVNFDDRAEVRNYTAQLQQQRETRLRYDNLRNDIKRRDDDVAQTKETLQANEDAANRAKSTFEEHQQRWQSWLNERHLPAAASPQSALQLFDQIQKIRDEVRTRDELNQQMQSLETQQQQYQTKVSELHSTLKRPAPPQGDIPAALRSLCEALDLQKSQEIERSGYLKQKAECQDDISIQEKRLADQQRSIAALLQTVNAVDEADFDSQANIAEQHQKIQQECRSLEEVLDSHSAPGPARLALENSLNQLDAVQIETKLYSTKEAVQECQNHLLEAERKRGEWDNRVQQWEKSEGQLAALLRQLEEQKTRIADLNAQWAKERITQTLLDLTRMRFEKERQPAVIKRAGTMMQQVTDGRYQAVVTSGSLSSVQLDEGEHGRKPLWHWSRGTREQFYLALRLAFIEDYCKQGYQEPLPVVMDDVLVHADGYQRLAAASAMIAAFAEKYQVLYFTCRPGDADTLQKAAPTARRFQLGKIIM